MEQEDRVLKAMMKQLGMKENEEIITEWPTWPFTKLTPKQVHQYELYQKRKLKQEQDQAFEDAGEPPF